MRLRWIVPLVMFAVSAGAPRAFAAGEADKATARELGQRGAEALQAKDYTKALDFFQRANQLYKAPTLTLGLGRSLAGLGRLVEAADVYNRMVSEGVGASASPAFRKAVDEARAELNKVEPRIGHVVIRVDGAPNATVKVDGTQVPAASLGIDRPIDPGKHEATAEAPGKSPAHETFNVPEGARATVSLVLQPGAGGADVASPGNQPIAGGDEPKPASSGRRTVGLVLVGVGAASLAAGGVTGVLAISKHSSLTDACNNQGVCPSTAVSTHDAFTTFATVSTVTFIAGGVLAAGGITLVLTAPKRAATTGYYVAPVIGPGFAGLRGGFE